MLVNFREVKLLIFIFIFTTKGTKNNKLACRLCLIDFSKKQRALP